MAQLDQWDGPDHATPLSPLGEKQADGLVEELARLPIERVLVSPFRRARQTAELAARLHNHEHQVIHDLRERDSGDWAKHRRDPDIAHKICTWDYVPPNGESAGQAATRALRSLSKLGGDHNTIVFAHGRVLANVLAVLDRVDLSLPIQVLPNCEVFERQVATAEWRKLFEALP